MSTYLEAREILRSAFRRVVGREPDENELSAGQAVADLETGYGRAPGQFRKQAEQGNFNWGALETGKKGGACPPGTFEGKDLGPVCFYAFPTDDAGAEGFLKTWAKPSTLEKARLGLEGHAPHEIALDMYRHQYFTNTWRGEDNDRGEASSENPGINHASNVFFQSRGGVLKFVPTQAEADARNVGEYAQAIANAWRRATSSAQIPGPPLVRDTGSSLRPLGWLSRAFAYLTGRSSDPSYAEQGRWILYTRKQESQTMSNVGGRDCDTTRTGGSVSGKRFRGLDVSAAQGSIDWDQVKAAGRDFVIIKATEAETGIDKKLSEYAHGAKAAGLQVSYYHFAWPVGSPETQARHFFATVQALGIPPDLPLALDLESHEELGGVHLVAWAERFVTELRRLLGANDVPILLYSYPFYLKGLGAALANSTILATVLLWIADYNHGANPSDDAIPFLIAPWTTFAIWQTIGDKSPLIPGIRVAVDHDVANADVLGGPDGGGLLSKTWPLLAAGALTGAALLAYTQASSPHVGSFTKFLGSRRRRYTSSSRHGRYA